MEPEGRLKHMNEEKNKKKEVEVRRVYFDAERELYELRNGKVISRVDKRTIDPVVSFFGSKLKQFCPETDYFRSV